MDDDSLPVALPSVTFLGLEQLMFTVGMEQVVTTGFAIVFPLVVTSVAVVGGGFVVVEVVVFVGMLVFADDVVVV